MKVYLSWFHNACAMTTVTNRGLIERRTTEGIERLHMLGRGTDPELFKPERRSETMRANWGADTETSRTALQSNRLPVRPQNLPRGVESLIASRTFYSKRWTSAQKLLIFQLSPLDSSLL